MLSGPPLRYQNILESIRASLLFRPLSLGLALCLLPAPPGLTSLSFVRAAQAAGPVNCVTNGSNYFVTDCTAPPALDGNVVQAFLSYHGLPSSDAALIKQYARSDVYTCIGSA